MRHAALGCSDFPLTGCPASGHPPPTAKNTLAAAERKPGGGAPRRRVAGGIPCSQHDALPECFFSGNRGVLAFERRRRDRIPALGNGPRNRQASAQGLKARSKKTQQECAGPSALLRSTIHPQPVELGWYAPRRWRGNRHPNSPLIFKRRYDLLIAPLVPFCGYSYRRDEDGNSASRFFLFRTGQQYERNSA